MADRPRVTGGRRSAPKPSGRPAENLPDFIAPATLVDRARAGDEWLHEIKLDRYRVALRRDSGAARMLTRSGLDWTARFKPIVAAATAPQARAAYIDGEVAVLGGRRRREAWRSVAGWGCRAAAGHGASAGGVSPRYTLQPCQVEAAK